jgi:serine/threonine-protein kinase
MKFCSTCTKTYTDGQTFCPDDGEVLQESPESFVGRVIDGKYRVESFIAQGGMGAVYRARHILLGDDVVIKTLRSEMRNNAEWLKRFQREGKAARAFRHPNAVTVYDLSSGSDGMIYMVMEFVEGHTLDKELKARGRFTPAEALEVLEPVADVLDAAHARGVVHRDLKPENIMLGSDGRGGTVIKVLDLGIAKIVSAGDVQPTGVTSLTIAGQILGTPYYMSPEQWGELPRDGNAEIDGRTDVYSLGIIFFELVAGKKPLVGTTLPELRQKHVSVAPPSLNEAAPGTTEEFGRVVARAMSKDRGDRPQTAGDFVDELRAALSLPPRTRGRGLHTTDGAGSFQTSGGTAATAHLARGTNAELRDTGTADTILTSEFETPETSRETNAQDARRATSGGRRHKGGRATVASESQAGTGYFDEEQETSPHGGGVSVTAPEPRPTFMPLIVGGALALLLVAGVGGWFMLKGRRAEPKPPTPVSETPPPPTPRPPAVPKAEAASYWFEAFEKAEDASGQRVAEASASLKSGQRFRFHFIPKTRGYLYIVGPGEGGNAQVMLLTAQGSGPLKSNLVGGGADFAFPSMGGARLKLDDNTGADEFTFIFSPTPIASPAFLAGKFLHELTPTEVKELEDFRAQFKADAPEVSARGDGPDRRVVVLAPEPATESGRPLIFDVRIDHR